MSALTSWAWLGLTDWISGVLRLKKHKENDSRRVLLRNSSTGKVVIVSVDPRTLHPVDGSLTSCRRRTSAYTRE